MLIALPAVVCNSVFMVRFVVLLSIANGVSMLLEASGLANFVEGVN